MTMNESQKLQKIRVFLEKLEQGIHEVRELLKDEPKQG